MITAWLPGTLMNLKSNRAHWSSAIRYKRTWRQRTMLAMRPFDPPIRSPRMPKRIHLAAQVWNLFDEHDGLRAACSPIIDGLRDASVIHNDDPTSGHIFTFSQAIKRDRRGVTITVELLPVGR